MSLHESIVTDLQRIIDDLGERQTISATNVADTWLRQHARGLAAPVEYLCRENLKTMARRSLAGRYAPGAEDEVEAALPEVFSGHLQQRYPARGDAGGEHVYKLLDALTDDDVNWNISTLRKSAKARSLHADALEAWLQSRRKAA